MKNFTLVSSLFLLLFAQSAFSQKNEPNNGLKHIMTAEEAAKSYLIGLNFVETNPPTGVIRNVEEFGNNDGALIRYPFGIPISLIKELAKDAKVTTVVANSTQQTTVTAQYQSNGVNLANCSFLIAPSDSYWARDYGPWYVTFGNNQVGIIDFPYNRPRANDDEIPKKVATSQGIPWFGMNVIHTGGNYMTNGIDQASSTQLVWDENPSQTHSQVAQKIHDYLGINNYMVEQDPNGTYIDHIDCWGKFLAPDKVLIRKVPSSHAQYAEIEATAAFYASQVCSYGTLYKVFRVNTPNNEPYTNSFILKNKVCVPIMGTANDAPALLAYTQAMPGYQIFGFLGNPSTPWESTDALHCRAHEMADQGMLMISHLPLHDSIPAQACFQIDADITAFSGQLIYPDSVWTIYKVNTGNWDTLTMTNTSGTAWSACIPGQMEGSMISYYIHAEDASNRASSLPYIGAPDPIKFYVKVSTLPNVVISPDTLLFRTFEDVLNGKTAIVRNYTNQLILINQVNNTGTTPFAWEIENWNMTLPYTIQAGDALSFKVKMILPVAGKSNYLCDTLFVNTTDYNNQVMICADPYLLTSTNESYQNQGVSVYPNPLKSSTTFNLYNEKEGKVSIEIYSVMGDLVSIPISRTLTQGTHAIAWEGTGNNGQKLVPGIYLYHITSGSEISTGKISILK
jgi:agmatine/peptidylarginine deiminase